jgi:hypothetical protein
MYAEDMYVDGRLLPKDEPRIAAAGWDIVAHLTANDVLIPDPNAARQRLSIDRSQRVFYGYLAKSRANPAVFVVAVRGTDGLVEWLIDAEFLLVPHPRRAGTQVEQGFFGIYQTMSLTDTAGVITHSSAAAGIAATVGAGTVTITGHSLGSAIATYLTQDVAAQLGARASACLFASPRTGDAAWTALFDATVVAGYQLYNYILDLVTHVPSLGYATLSKATVLQPSTAQAHIRLDVLCNHHVLCYCAMIDFAETKAAPTTEQDASCKLCISPPPMSEAAKGLAALVTEFGVGNQRAVVMLKALHTISAV